jgi:hypothetical protein
MRLPSSQGRFSLKQIEPLRPSYHRLAFQLIEIRIASQRQQAAFMCNSVYPDIALVLTPLAARLELDIVLDDKCGCLQGNWL